ENERDRAVAEDRGAREGLEPGMQLAELLDDGLVVADDLVDDEPDASLARGNDHHLLVPIRLTGSIEDVTHADEGHEGAADVEEVAAARRADGFRRQLDALLD